MLTKALRSALSQTDTDFEIIFIVDMKKRGVYWANEQYSQHTHRIQGQYVYTLDDDTFLPQATLIQNIKRIAAQNKQPDVIMVRGKRPQLAPNILPKESVWKHRDRLKVATTNGACYIAKAECWRKYANRYGAKAAGDWNFLKMLKQDDSLSFYWFDFIAKETQQLGRGKKFENVGKDWWKRIVKAFKVEYSKDGFHMPVYLWSKAKIQSILKGTK